MNRQTRTFCFVALTLAGLAACGSKPPAQESQKATAARETIQGKAQVMVESSGLSGAALNAGRQNAVFLWVGERRYRLFLKTALDIEHGKEYVVEGIHAQKAIDEIGDPDQGKNGYPLLESCQTVVKMAWRGLPFDEADLKAEALRAAVKRYPARALFLVTGIRLAPAGESTAASGEAKKGGAAEDKNIPEISVAAEKQRALLLEGPTSQPAPLWEPAAGTVRCRVVIGPEGKISELDTGAQLCEHVPWSQFRYKPTIQRGHPVKVRTEVEVRYEPRK